jgi:hypothetical protein
VAHIRHLKKFTTFYKPLCGELHAEDGDTGDVAAGAAKAGDEAERDRVAPCHKDDRYGRGRGLRSECRRSARDCDNHGHFAANEIGQQRWKSIVLILRPAVFDSYVLALDIAGFAQALMERAQTAREHVRAEPPHRGVARETVTLSVEGREVQVEVVRQPRHLGGSQAYWRCPKCEALRSHLYVAGNELACRCCHKLDYRSRHVLHPALTRAAKLRRALNAPAGILAPLPARPRNVWPVVKASVARPIVNT